MITNSSARLLRPVLTRIHSRAFTWILLIFLIHASVRFGGLLNPLFIPLSMVIVWPLPWLLSNREGRRRLYFKKPVSVHWLITGPLAAAGLLLFSAAAAWLFFGQGEANWFVRHAGALRQSLSGLPAETTPLQAYWVATLPAMLFSPLGEEFLYRGYLQRSLSDHLGNGAGISIQALLFAGVHMAHYGLHPFQPSLLVLFLPSMFAAGLLFGWILIRSESIWCAVISHSIYNAGLNGVVFLLLEPHL